MPFDLLVQGLLGEVVELLDLLDEGLGVIRPDAELPFQVEGEPGGVVFP